jgi:peptide/nickel transport system permease protein
MTRKLLLAFIARRLLLTVVLLVVLSLVVFSLIYITPGTPEQALIGNHDVTAQQLANIKHKYHLDQPFLVQFGHWLVNAVRLNFGTSIQTQEPVSTMLRQSSAVTIFLGLYSFVVAVGVGVPLGVLAALRHRRSADRTVVGLSVLISSTPVFVTGIALLYVFAVVFKIFPAFGAGTGFRERLWHLTLPAITLGAAVSALVVKLTRTAMINALEQDYVAFARARGASWSRVLVRYALRNALVPIITAGGLVLTAVLGGSVLTEVTFTLSGLGELLITAVNGKDYPVVQGVALVIAALVVLVNLLVDVTYALVDPRIAFGKGR